MATNVRAHAQADALPAQARCQRIKNHDQNRHANHEQHRPGVDSFLEREPGGVEGEIVLEVRIALAESHTKTRHCQRCPRWKGWGRRRGDDYRQNESKPVNVFSRNRFAELDVGEATRQCEHSDAASECRQIEKGEEDRDDGADSVDEEKITRSLCPQWRGAERCVPGVISVESGRCASANQNRRRDDDSDEEAPAGRWRHVTPSRLWSAASPASPLASRPAALSFLPRNASPARAGCSK